MPIKKKIGILGSTGSVGKTTLDLISEFPKLFSVDLLVCNNQYDKILYQVKKFLPNFVYIQDEITRNKIKAIKFSKKIIILDNYQDLKKILKKKKFDKIIHAISSFEGLKYAFNSLTITKQLLIANKESIICGGKILLNKAKQNNCKITSIDSEHYCLSRSLNNCDNLNKIETVYLTASGGPFLGLKRHFFAKASIKKVTNHPNWSMGNKISVDSATLVNKFFEIIEAHLLFGIPLDKIKIKIHKQSLVHSAVVFKNGLVELIMHDTIMTIPIRNSLFEEQFYGQKNNFFRRKSLFSLDFSEKDLNQFDIVKLGNKILKKGHTSWILFNFFNDMLVKKFLNKEIFFYEIVNYLIKIFNKKSVLSYCSKKIHNQMDIKKTIIFGEKVMDKI